MNWSSLKRAIPIVFLIFCCSIAAPVDAGLITGDTGGNQPHDNIQPSLALNYMIALQGLFPPRSLTADDLGSSNLGTDPFIGSVGLFGGNFAPRGWALTSGQLLSISSNTALFSLFGTLYGGDGRTTFALPDLRGRAAMHSGQGAGLSPRALGARYGQEDASLDVSNLPNHNHSVVPETSTLLLTAWGLLAVGLLRGLRQRRA